MWDAAAVSAVNPFWRRPFPLRDASKLRSLLVFFGVDGVDKDDSAIDLLLRNQGRMASWTS